MDEYLLMDRPHPAVPNGKQKVYRFPNNYGASVVSGGENIFYTDSAHPCELAVIWFQNGENDYDLDYSTPITNDVIGHLDEAGVLKCLEEIKLYPPKSLASWTSPRTRTEHPGQ